MYRKTLPANTINNLQRVNQVYIKLQESEVSELRKAHKAELTQYIYIYFCFKKNTSKTNWTKTVTVNKIYCKKTIQTTYFPRQAHGLKY